MDIAALEDGACLRIPLHLLSDAPWGNVRQQKRDEKQYAELKASIKLRGVTQAISVRPTEDASGFEVLAGYGRREASSELGLADIPAVVKRVDDREGMAIGLIENLQREDLNVVDEIRASRQFVSLSDGNYEEAANALGWSERKVRARLKLNDCCDTVLDALASGEIRFGHAEVLCLFSKKLQQGTLAKIIDEDLTVDELKQRANVATTPLRHAKFDKTDCQNCQYNSSVQASLFTNHVGADKCSNLPCFQKKTEQWLHMRKSEIEGDYGIVLLELEKPDSDRETVGADVVGKNAYQNDCLNCEKRISVMKGGFDADVGEIISDQCINLSCFREKVAAKAESEKPKSIKTKPASARKAKAKKRISTPSVSGGVRRQAMEFVQSVIGEALLQDEAYRLAVTLHALMVETRYKVAGIKGFDAISRVPSLAKLGTEKLKQEIQSAIEFGTLQNEPGIPFNGIETVGKATQLVDAPEKLVTARWSPSEQWLGAYLKGGIESLCRQSEVGFADAFDKANGDGAFAKLMKRRKDELIKEILSFQFDWAEVVPAEVRSLVAGGSR